MMVRELRPFDAQACGLPLFQPALMGADVLVAELHQLLRGHAAQRTLRAAAVYDDLGILGQIRARTSLPTLSRGTRREPAMFSPSNHSSVSTFQSWTGRLFSRS